MKGLIRTVLATTRWYDQVRVVYREPGTELRSKLLRDLTHLCHFEFRNVVRSFVVRHIPFLAKDIEFKGIGNRDETEEIEVIKVPLPDVESRLSSLNAEGNAIDLKIYGLIELARKHLRFE